MFVLIIEWDSLILSMPEKKIDVNSIIVIVLLSLFTGLVYNAFSGNTIPLIRSKLSVKFEENVVPYSNEKTQAVKLISHDTAVKLHNEGKIFIDARDQWDFSEGRIPGALNIPEYSFDESNNLFKSLSKTEITVIYCGGDDCDTSIRLADKFGRLGFTSVYVYQGGFTEWKAKNHSVETGDNK